jgi:superfamily II DNA or RNA helicase
MLQLRDYQQDILDKLRNGFAAGYDRQILYAPTGAGKTEMAIALLEATRKKLNRGAMVLDRIILCEQTSRRLDFYSIDHGILQAGHWRFKPYEKIQICSAQTLERREELPGLNLLIVDEAHQTRDALKEFIFANPELKVIGLSATPFTKGLGKVYENVISSVTTDELVKRSVLVPLRVFISTEIDMTGANKVAGEWSQKETTERGMKITGDIIAEWIKMTHEIFNRPRKTIVFCSGVAHGNDLSRKFAEKGYNFISLSYHDTDTFKREVIEDFSKPDTEIHGLIATDILTKGFDVPDVMIGVSARPFSKSLTSHIQQMGRVMRGSPGKEFALWLDHSGNYLRFKDDWEDVYNNGVQELDDSKEKSKKEKTAKEKQEAVCPSCKALWTSGTDTCTNCGFVVEGRNKIIELAGELKELKGAMSSGDQQSWWSQLCYFVEHDGMKSGHAAYIFKDKFGYFPKYLRDVAAEPTAEVHNFIESRKRQYIKSIRRKR